MHITIKVYLYIHEQHLEINEGSDTAIFCPSEKRRDQFVASSMIASCLSSHRCCQLQNGDTIIGEIQATSRLQMNIQKLSSVFDGFVCLDHRMHCIAMVTQCHCAFLGRVSSFHV